MPVKTAPVRYAPNGVVTKNPVLMRLMPAERAMLQKHAQAANSSLSAFARRMTLVGLAQLERSPRRSLKVAADDSAVSMRENAA